MVPRHHEVEEEENQASHGLCTYKLKSGEQFTLGHTCFKLQTSLILISCQSTDFLPSCSASVIITSIHKELLLPGSNSVCVPIATLQVQLTKPLQQNPIILAFDV